MDNINPISAEIIQKTGAIANSSGNFSDWIIRELREVDSSIQEVEGAAKSVISGDIENLHHIMSRISDAEIKLQFALQVRDKALEAYQEILRMQL